MWAVGGSTARGPDRDDAELIPPKQITTGSPALYVGILLGEPWYLWPYRSSCRVPQADMEAIRLGLEPFRLANRGTQAKPGFQATVGAAKNLYGAPCDRSAGSPVCKNFGRGVSAKAGSKKGQMNLWSVSSMGIGAMVGAGIFALLARWPGRRI